MQGVDDLSSIGDAAMGGGMAGANQMFNLHHGEYGAGAYDPAIIGNAEGLAQYLSRRYGSAAARAAARNAREAALARGNDKSGYNAVRASVPFAFAQQRIGGGELFPGDTDQFARSYRNYGINRKEVQAARRNMRQHLFGKQDQWGG